MKKLITTAVFLMFGTLFINAQTTQKKYNTKAKAEKNLKSRGMKSKTNETKMVDTANLDKRQKIEDNKLQRQAVPEKDGLYNEAVKPSQPQPVPGQLE